jgi:hypothetical protein
MEESGNEGRAETSSSSFLIILDRAPYSVITIFVEKQFVFSENFTK